MYLVIYYSNLAVLGVYSFNYVKWALSSTIFPTDNHYVSPFRKKKWDRKPIAYHRWCDVILVHGWSCTIEVDNVSNTFCTVLYVISRLRYPTSAGSCSNIVLCRQTPLQLFRLFHGSTSFCLLPEWTFREPVFSIFATIAFKSLTNKGSLFVRLFLFILRARRAVDALYWLR